MLKKRKLTIDQMRDMFATPKKANYREGYVNISNTPLDGDPLILRFLPDLDDENPHVWVVKKTVHTIKDSSGKWHTVPCLARHNPEDTTHNQEVCPFCKASAELYAKGDKALGKTFYRKDKFITQAVVVSDPVESTEEYESLTGKVAKVELTKAMYERIISQCSALSNASFIDDEAGCDYEIRKSIKDKWNNYDLSNFARRETTIDYADYEKDMIKLKDLLPIVDESESTRIQGEFAFLSADLLGVDVETPAQGDNDLLSDADDIMDIISARKAAG